jgi:ankyrin repeat protein
MHQENKHANSSSHPSDLLHNFVKTNNILGLRIAAYFAGRGGRLDRLDKDGSTALHVAVMRDNIACARILLKNGANPNIAEKERYASDGRYFARRTPLFYAIRRDGVKMIELLVSYGANIDDLKGERASSTGEKDPAI